MADIDGDGDIDAVIGKIDGSLIMYRNDEGSMTELTGDDDPFDGLDFVRSVAPEFGDLDGDGDMDLLVTQVTGLFYYFENTGSVATRQYTKTLETNVFPNPSSEMITVEAPWLKSTGVLSIIDVSGKVIQQQHINTVQSSMSLSNLPGGSYFITLESQSGNAIKQVIKK